MAIVGAPNHRCVLSIFPQRMSATWRHNGFTSYEHASAPRDQILRRTFEWRIGPYCSKHPDHAHSTKDLRDGFCRFPMNTDSGICGRPFEERPRWHDVLTPCEKDQGYAVYVIHDARCYGRDWSQDAEVYRADPVDAQSIVTDFVNIYSGGMIGTDKGFRPGILAMNGDEPTEEELAQVRAQQVAYFEFLVLDAISIHNNPKENQIISGLHRLACAWIGRTDLPFMIKMEQRQTKPCPACTEIIAYRANRCNQCHTDLDSWYESKGLVPDEKEDPFVADLMRRKAEAKKRQHQHVDEPSAPSTVIGAGKTKAAA
jgi:hypothetical protein